MSGWIVIFIPLSYISSSHLLHPISKEGQNNQRAETKTKKNLRKTFIKHLQITQAKTLHLINLNTTLVNNIIHLNSRIKQWDSSLSCSLYTI